MLNFRWVRVFAIVVAFESAAFCSGKHWLQIQSSHLTVVTDASEKRGIEVARRCEELRAAFSVLMNRAVTRDPAPLLILALDGEKEVDELRHVPGGRLKHAGIFLPGTDESFILVNVSEDLSPTVLHEYAHELLYANTSSAIQTWFDEGFAQYFSTLQAGGKTTEIGLVPVAELQFLRQNGKLMRLADLMQISQESELYNRNGPSEATFYAESWLLVHYLFDHQLIGKAEPLFAQIAARVTLDSAVQSAFGMSVASLERELMAYAKGEAFRYFVLPVNQPSEIIKAATLPETSADAIKADVRWHLRTVHSRVEAGQYVAENKRILSVDPSDSFALRGLATGLRELGDYDSALRALHQAITIQPENPMNHHELAIVLDATENQQPASKFGPELEQEALASIRLDPDYADAYRLLSSGYLHDGNFEEAAVAIKTAMNLNPRQETYGLALADIELKANRYSDALLLLNALKGSRNPEISKRANYFLSANAEKFVAGASN